MNDKKLRKKIYRIIDKEVYIEAKTFFPTEKDLKKNPNMHPGFSHILSGKQKAARKIMELLKIEE